MKPRPISLAIMLAALLWQGAFAAPGLNPDWAVVLPPAKALSLLKQCSRHAPGRNDTGFAATGPIIAAPPPTQQEIADLESGLSMLLADRLAQAQTGRPARDYKFAADYYRQYAAISIAGRREIYVNGFHRSTIDVLVSASVQWGQDPVLACDGGDEFFGVEYDPAAKSFSGFAFNGPA